nr:hypothetical protein [Tanacetum cinerariifolium]
MLHVLRVKMVINSPWMLSKNWLVQKQTALGKDTSNPLIVDSLLKTIWFSIHHHLTIEVLAIPRQTANGKESSNPLMAGVNTPRSDEDRLKIMELMVFLMKKGVCDEIGFNAARLSKLPLSGKWEEGTHTYVLFHVLSDGFTNPQNNNKDALVDGKEHDDDIQKFVSPDIHSSSCGDQTSKQECINNSSNEVNAAGSSLSAARLNFTNSTNDFSVVGPSNAAMPNLEDLSHNADDGAEADINNMESIISVSPIPTTRIHKDYLTTQIIGDMSSTTQTRSMARAVRDQGGISQMFNEDFHTCMFACFLSQEEPKRVHQALNDPSWIEAMQEELLQFKIQK